VVGGSSRRFLRIIECLIPNPLSGWLPATQLVHPAAGSYFVYLLDLSTNELQKANNPTIPVFSLSGSPRPAGSALTAFLACDLSVRY
jgi:hypothetical protein